MAYDPFANALDPRNIKTEEPDYSKLPGKESLSRVAVVVPTPAPQVDQNFSNFVNWMKAGQPTNVDTSSPIKPGDLSNTSTINTRTNQMSNKNGSALSGIVGPAVEQAQMDYDTVQKAQTQATKTPQQTYTDEYLKLTQQAGGRAQETLDLQDKYDVEQKTKAVNDINSRMITTSRAYDKQLREIEKNTRGALSSGVNIELQRVSKMRDEQLADLAIQKSVALGDLETANKIVETTIAAKYEPIQQQLDNYKTLIDINNNNMTEREKFEAQQNYQNAKDTLNYYQGLQFAAINDANQAGQSGVASEILRLDPSAPDFQAKLANLQGKIVKQKTGELSTREQILLNNAQTKWQAADEASKTFRVARDTAGRVLVDPKNAQTQLSTLYQYVKMLDANSAVREGEVTLANNTASFVNKFQKTYESILSGSSVGSNTAKLMANEAIALASAWEKESSRQKNNIIAGTRNFGLEDEMRSFINYADILNADQTGVGAGGGNDDPMGIL